MALWLVALFGSVTLHELSHSVVAMRLGLKVHDIVLLPIGGVSEISGMETSASIEGKVAAAGPLASVVLGVAFIVVSLATGHSAWPPALTTGSWFARLGWLNLALAAFNLLPALPMDGGRIFRSLLSRASNNLRATRIAAVVAGLFGLAMIVYGVKEDFFLILIGGFVLMGANAEFQSAKVRAALGDLRVGRVMHPDQTTVPATVPAAQVAGWLAYFPGRAVPVVDDAGRYLGIADMGDLSRHAAHFGGTAVPGLGTVPGPSVGDLCDRQAPCLTPEMILYPGAVESFQMAHRRDLAVVADGHVVGIIYAEAVNTALQQATAGGMGPR